MGQKQVAALWVLCAALGGPARAHGVSGKVQVGGGKGAENSVVYLSSPGKSFPPPAEQAVMDQRTKTFVPHVLVVMKGQKVSFPNTDLIRHNVFSPSKTHKFNLGIYPPGLKKEEMFDQAGVVSLLCNVHPEMSAFIVVVETPWFAVVGPDGSYRINDVPSGKYEVVAWHEGLPELRKPLEVKGDVQLNLAVKK